MNALGSASAAAKMPVRPQFLSPITMNRMEGRPAVRSPLLLRLHRALDELGWTGAINEFNDAALLPNPSVTEPILITTNGTILSGFGRWRAAVFDGRFEINCIEYPLSEDSSIPRNFSYTRLRSVDVWRRG